MKRYTLSTYEYSCEVEAELDPEGDWVRWEEANDQIEQLKVAVREALYLVEGEWKRSNSRWKNDVKYFREVLEDTE